MKRLKLALAGMSFLLCLLAPTVASADVNNFTITSFTADQTLSRADPQGELRVVEHIQVDFTDYNHGLLRAIPNRYKGHSLQMRINSIGSRTNAPVEYSTYGSNGNTVIKIGSPSRTVTGPQEYTIDYTLRNVISFQTDHDELYWNVNGTQWEQPFKNVAVTLHLPQGVQQTQPPVCFAGSQGETTRDCIIASKGQTITAATSGELSPNQTLTFAASFEKGYFTPSRWYETIGEYSRSLLEFFVPVILIGGGSALYWYFRGRDPKGKEVIIPQYEPPENLKPLAVGAVMDFKIDNKDITATIVDLAVRKYIKIIETITQRKLRKDASTYSLQIINDNLEALDEHERSILNALFDQKLQKGRQVDLSKLKSNFQATAQTIRSQLSKELTASGYFRNNPLQASKKISIPLILIVIAVLFAGKTMDAWLIAGLVVGGIIGFFFATQMAARTQRGVAAKEHILGLKRYLEVAEKDRINALQSPNAKYAAPNAEPVRTVDLFEKLLPYAMVLGVEKQWATQFEGLYQTPPDWYSGNWSTFSALYLVSSLNSGIGSTVNTAFSAPSGSGGSGFSGGFSGGGGGGGGGGGW